MRQDLSEGESNHTGKICSQPIILQLANILHVVGMTYGACQGPSYLPAGIPGVSTALE
jgi:hypothetical protein